MLLIALIALHHIVVVACHQRIPAIQRHIAFSRPVVQRSTPATEQRIELGQRAMVNNGFASLEQQTVFLGIRQLHVVERHLRVMGIDGIASAIMYHAVSQHHLRTVCPDTVPSIAHLRVCQPTAPGIAGNRDARPLSAHAVVGQVVEHVVQTVASQQTVVSHQTSLNQYAGLAMEEELRIPQRQRGILGDVYAVTIDNQGLLRLDGHILIYFQVIDLLGIPTVGAKVHLLLHPTLQGQQQVVLHQLRFDMMVLVGGYLHENQQAIALAHLEVLSYRVQEGTVQIDAETGLVTLL